MAHKNEDREKLKKDMAKAAVASAMKSQWAQAADLNRSILGEFPEDLEAYNRLGKALTEIGQTAEAKEAFQNALGISPHNAIARKNLERLTQLGDDAPKPNASGGSAPYAFIEESGKAGVTSLTNPAAEKTLLRMAPGHPVQLSIESGALKVTDRNGEYLGQVEPKMAARLARLIDGGNRYEAAVTSVGPSELTVIIREVYRHPSQSGTVSFPSRGSADYRVFLPSATVGNDVGGEETEESDAVAVKDWSSDDTEPGDDDAFSPVVHRIINPSEDGKEDDEDY